MMTARQVILDTETTGLEYSQGHRIIEIGAVEVINRRLTKRQYHQYLQPDREIDEGAMAVHGISNEFLADKPRFADVVVDFMTFIDGAELIIHNAAFDVGFINYELSLLDNNIYGKIADSCHVTDTLAFARQLHPGQKNNLDALCRRYDIDNSKRDLHGALLDAEILADVYLAMTGGQVSLLLSDEENHNQSSMTTTSIQRISADRAPLPIIEADEVELAAHQQYLKHLQKTAGHCIWNQLEDEGATIS